MLEKYYIFGNFVNNFHMLESIKFFMNLPEFFLSIMLVGWSCFEAEQLLKSNMLHISAKFFKLEFSLLCIH